MTTTNKQNESTAEHIKLPFGKMLHELAAILPEMSEAEFADLVKDLRESKRLLEKITLDHTGKYVVDGRNRLKACERSGVKPKFRRLAKNVNIAHFILSKNLHRRHFTQSQRAAYVVELLLPRFKTEAKERQKLSKSKRAQIATLDKGKATDQAAAAGGVSGRHVRTAAKLKKEAPEKFEEVKRGKLTLSKATPKADKPKAKKSDTPVSPPTPPEPGAPPPKQLVDVDPDEADFTPAVRTPDATIWEKVEGWVTNIRGLLNVLSQRGVNVDDGVEALDSLTAWVRETVGDGALVGAGEPDDA